MEYWIKGKSFLAALAGVLGIVSSSWAAQPTKVRMSYSSRSNSNTPFVIALRKGFFAEEGMDVEMIQVNPRLGATALLNGDIDFTATFGSTLRSIVGGFPLKFVAVSVKKSEHFLIVRPEIKEIRDLNGKKLGVSTLFGSDQKAAEEMIRGKGFSANMIKPITLGDLLHRAADARVQYLFGAGEARRPVVADEQRLGDLNAAIVDPRIARSGASAEATA